MDDSLRQKDLAHYLHAMTPLAVHERRGPTVLHSGKGAYVTDVDGVELLDGFAGLWCVNVGYGQESVIQAASEQLRRLPYAGAFTHFANEPVIELAAKLASITPPSVQHALFTLGGSDAVESALKIARYAHAANGEPERRHYVSLDWGYHGSAFVGCAVSGLPYMHPFLGLDFEFVHHIPSHYPYRHAAGPDSQAIIDASVRAFEAVIAEVGAGKIAAFISEPFHGAGGVVVPPVGWLTAMQNVCREHGIFFIVDEVITGFCRTGKMFACEHENLEPDLMTMAKGLTSAYVPMGGVMLSDAIYRSLVDKVPEGTVFGHGFTYSGHPVSAATALAVIKLYEDGLLEQSARVGAHLQRRLAEFVDDPWVGDVRGLGMAGALELVQNKETKESFPVASRVGLRIMAAAYENGLIFRAMGRDVLGIAPPLVCTESDIDELVDRLRRSIEQVRAEGVG
jgi:adenosylmethionine-8-amino-7-oxononanoate aminotransferase